MSAKTQELLTAISAAKQADIATKTADADLVSLSLPLGSALAQVQPIREDNAAEFGKGHEFATATYPSHYVANPPAIDKYLSSYWAAWVLGYSLGKSAKTGSTPNWIYTITPLDGVTDDTCELPYITYVEQIRPGANVVIDRAIVGCVINDWTLSLTKGPGRANSKLSCNLIGSGKLTEPSTVTIPAQTSEILLGSATLAATINSVDYVTAKTIESLELTWNNNVNADGGFYPGSGTQDSFAIRGRLEHGSRALTLKFVARFLKTSTEITKLKAGTAGTAVITLTAGVNDNLTITLQQIQFQTVEMTDVDGFICATVTASCQYHTTNKLIECVAKVSGASNDNICQTA